MSDKSNKLISIIEGIGEFLGSFEGAKVKTSKGSVKVDPDSGFNLNIKPRGERPPELKGKKANLEVDVEEFESDEEDDPWETDEEVEEYSGEAMNDR